MRNWRAALAVVYLALPGCVIGYGPCLFQQPVKQTLVGRVHFRDYPAPDGVDNVPILALDKTAYVYAPALSHLCLSANDVQLVGVAEFPRNVIEGTQVTVDGMLHQETSSREHTAFVLRVNTILPVQGGK